MRIRGVGRLKHYLRIAIATHRRSPVVKTLHALASFMESAYANECSVHWFSGEVPVIKKLRAARFGIVFDVGANFGDWSSVALEAWPECQVHAFEVAPATYERLHKNFSRPEMKGRIIVNCLGLAEKSGEREMYYFPEHPDMSG
ncbi:MAG: FkbM family methyltransferase, partial [Acidobacteriia bacterium]|nr:FkbM family methyltransferase [Terriglobia bacterium]